MPLQAVTSKGSAVRLVAEALPLNEGPKEQVADLLDVLRAQPAPVIQQQQTQHIQGQISQSCFRIWQEEEEGQVKKSTLCLRKLDGKHHPKSLLSPGACLSLFSPALCCCGTARLRSSPSRVPAPGTLSFPFSFEQPQIPY